MCAVANFRRVEKRSAGFEPMSFQLGGIHVDHCADPHKKKDEAREGERDSNREKVREMDEKKE